MVSFSCFVVLFFVACFHVSFLAQPSPCTFLIHLGFPMDHAQGCAFHHHLARAIMHLNHLAGLLPFFEPSIEYEDSSPPTHFRLEHPASQEFRSSLINETLLI